MNADHLNGQINELNQQNSENRQVQDALEAEAASLADKISRLQMEINGLEKQIQDNQVKNYEVQKQITAAEEELARQKDFLGQNIRRVYIEGDISTPELLASSKDLSEYFDKQVYP